jgi:hypothetical protein
MPIAMASPPSDIRLAEIPNTFIRIKAKKTENGIEAATTILGRRPPMNTRRTRATRATPCTSASMTVLTAFPTSVA